MIDAAQAVNAAKKTTLSLRTTRITQVIIELSLHLAEIATQEAMRGGSIAV
jgi:hypothetical protein